MRVPRGEGPAEAEMKTRSPARERDSSHMYLTSV